MAGVSGSPKPSRTCQGLLEKLKQGQDVLRRSIKGIKPPVELAAASRQILGQRKLESLSRDSLTIALDRTSKLPRKRARLQQLSPGYEVETSIEDGFQCYHSNCIWLLILTFRSYSPAHIAVALSFFCHLALGKLAAT